MFEYDPAVPLEVVESGTFDRGGATVHDITYANPHGGTVSGYLVVPGVAGSCWEWGWFPAVIYMHGRGQSRESFLPEAITLAPAGVISLVIDSPFLRRLVLQPAAPVPQARYESLVVGVRRAIDLLATRPDIDPARIAFVGNGFGATIGGALAGADSRIRSYVLIEGMACPSAWYRHRTPSPGTASGREAVTQDLDALATLDAQHDIGRAAPAAVLFQFARRNKAIPPAEAQSYFDLASAPKEIVWYDTGRPLPGFTPASLDRIRWLSGQLGF